VQVKLNLGCCGDIRPGWINVDNFDHAGVDVVHDLNTLPWPWEDGSVDEIYIAHTLEHLWDTLASLLELHRILKVGGVLEIRVPHVYGETFSPAHLRFFASASFACLTQPTSMNYDWREKHDPPFRLLDYRLRLRIGVSTPFDRLFGRWPRAFERLSPVKPGEIIWRGEKL